jgi:hypothetical protein
MEDILNMNIAWGLEWEDNVRFEIRNVHGGRSQNRGG